MRNSKSSVCNTNFFPGQGISFFCFTLSLHWRYCIPSLVWFGQLLDPMKKNFFKILKNSQFAKVAKFRMKTQFFFPTQAVPKILFALHFHPTGDTPYRVWFDFDNSWPDEKELFLKFSIIPNSRNWQNSVWEFIFFLDKLYQNFFLLYTLITLVILHTASGLMSATPCPMKKTFF